jgi:dTDP-4-dehydrorhamnose reductase
MLGMDLEEQLKGRHQLFGIANIRNKKQTIRFKQLELTDRKGIDSAMCGFGPDVVIHTAAFTAVDECESKRALAFEVNQQGTELISKISARINATLFFISTDYVFEGEKDSPYTETDRPNPKSVYGASKLAGEKAVQEHGKRAFIVRTSWLYGAHGSHFFRAIINKIAEGQTLQVVNDQRGAPTYTKDLARVLASMIEKLKGRDARGCDIYHVANAGETTWFEAAQVLVKKTKSAVRVEPQSSNALNRAAIRPKNSTLNLDRLKNDFNIQTRTWEKALDAYWSESLSAEWQALQHSKQS